MINLKYLDLALQELGSIGGTDKDKLISVSKGLLRLFYISQEDLNNIDESYAKKWETLKFLLYSDDNYINLLHKESTELIYWLHEFHGYLYGYITSNL